MEGPTTSLQTTTRGFPGQPAVYPNRPAIGVAAMSSYAAQDPAFRIRLQLPAAALAAYGVEVELLPLLSPDQAQRFRHNGLAGKAIVIAQARTRMRKQLLSLPQSTVIVQRHVDLAPPLTLEKAAIDGRRLIYDVDDAIWLTGRQTGGHILSSLKGNARKVRWLAERAEHVIAGNEILANHLERHNGNLTVVPSLVDPSAYPVRAHGQREHVTLGWIGSPTTARYLRGIVPALERFAAGSRRPVLLLVIGGSAPPIDGMEVDQRPWSEQSERHALSEMDIGLMPLPDTAWTRGKCAYKALQYMASGIPPVVDDVGISATTIADAGCVARTTSQWLEGLHSLAEDPSLRTRLGRVGRERVEGDFSLDRWLPTLAAILRRGEPGERSV